MSVPRDQAYTNFRVTKTLVCGNLVTASAALGALSLAGGLAGDVLVNDGNGNAVWSDALAAPNLDNGTQFQNIQQQVKQNNHLAFVVNNLYNQVLSGNLFPAFPVGRTITFTNNTSATTLDVYLSVGYPQASGYVIIPGGQALAPTQSVVWNIPTTQNWSGNFLAMPTGTPPPLGGTTLAEFGLNQLWSGFVPSQRDTFDISTVPPGVGTQCNDGPHSSCVAISAATGRFTAQESKGYNVGIEIIPPSGSLASQTVTCTSSDGESPNSVGFPNDTAFPKQQTIECTGNYSVNFMDPVVS